MNLRALGRLLGAHPILAVGVALLLRSELGAAPWDVFHAGLAHTSGLSVGASAIATGLAAVIVARLGGVRPGVGTLINAVVLGGCIDLALAAVPAAPGFAVAAGYLAGGIALLGLGTGLYLSARLGAGPRDSMMVALAGRRGWTTARARAAIEFLALGVGVALGGRAGAGTVIYAAAIGPVAQWATQLFLAHPALDPAKDLA